MAIVEVQGDTQAPAFQLRPLGTYDLRIEGVERVEASSPEKSPYLKVRSIITGVREAQNQMEVSKEATFILSLSEKSATRLRQFLDQAGIDYQVGPDGRTGLRFDTDALIGRYVRGKCAHRMWNGQNRENWGDWEVVTGVAAQPTGYAPPAQGGLQPPPAAAPQGYAPPQAGQGFAPPVAQPTQGPPQAGFNGGGQQ